MSGTGKKKEKKPEKIRMARMSHNFHMDRGLVGHPALWSVGEAVGAIMAFTYDPNLACEHVWPRYKHVVPPGSENNTRILIADSASPVPGTEELCKGIGKSLVGGPAAVNHDRQFKMGSARVTRQVRAAAITWMTVRDAVPAEHRSATMEILRAQLIAMIAEIIPKVARGGQEDAFDHTYFSEDDAPDLNIRDPVPGWPNMLRTPDESDEEGRDERRASIHTGGPLHRHCKRPRGPGQTTPDEWRSSHGLSIAGGGRAAGGGPQGY